MTQNSRSVPFRAVPFLSFPFLQSLRFGTFRSGWFLCVCWWCGLCWWSDGSLGVIKCCGCRFDRHRGVDDDDDGAAPYLAWNGSLVIWQHAVVPAG